MALRWRQQRHPERMAMLALLLEWGADVNLQGVRGTALQAAARRGHFENTKLLLEHGADVNLQGELFENSLQ